MSRAKGERAAVREGPAHRFYVLEGYQVSYQVDPVTRRVIVLKLAAASE